jgi:hypothetical protein
VVALIGSVGCSDWPLRSDIADRLDAIYGYCGVARSDPSMQLVAAKVDSERQVLAVVRSLVREYERHPDEQFKLEHDSTESTTLSEQLHRMKSALPKECEAVRRAIPVE